MCEDSRVVVARFASVVGSPNQTLMSSRGTIDIASLSDRDAFVITDPPECEMRWHSQGLVYAENSKPDGLRQITFHIVIETCIRELR